MDSRRPNFARSGSIYRRRSESIWSREHLKDFPLFSRLQQQFIHVSSRYAWEAVRIRVKVTTYFPSSMTQLRCCYQWTRNDVNARAPSCHGEVDCAPRIREEDDRDCSMTWFRPCSRNQRKKSASRISIIAFEMNLHIYSRIRRCF